MKAVIISFIIFLWVANNLSFAQTEDYKTNFKTIFAPQEHKHSNEFTSFKSNNELEFTLKTLFWFYKTLISSQDMNTCTFYPSCSVYSLQAIKSKGIFTGTFMSFDRLTRCNPFNDKDYIKYKNTGLKYDPVQKK